MKTLFNKDFTKTEDSEILGASVRDALRYIIHQYILCNCNPFEIKQICHENIDKLITDEIFNLVSFINNKEYENLDEIIITDEKRNNIKVIKFETYNEHGNKLYKYYEGFYPENLPYKIVELNGNKYYIIIQEL